MTAQNVPVRRRRWWIWVLVIIGTLLLLSCCCVTTIAITSGSFLGGRLTAPKAIVETHQDTPSVVPPVVAPQASVCPEGIPAGQTVMVPAGCVVLGDVRVNGQVYYDEGGSGQATVIIVEGSPIEVTAEWGAGIEETISYSSMSNLFDTYVTDELITGCGSPDGCIEVRFVVFRNGEIVFDQIKQ